LHELLHVYDFCTGALPSQASCAQKACSEVRAVNLSGECRWYREFFFNNMQGGHIVGHKRVCVRRNALRALNDAGDPACSGAAAERALTKVFDTCYASLDPFDVEEERTA
jgi:inner membrane protease ATP23